MNAERHILIVDDDPELCALVENCLTRAGYQVSIAPDAAHMRQAIATGPVDLVLLDLNLPDEDGLSLTRFLRERSDIGILIVTGMGETVDRVVGLEMGADDYLAKPFDLRELLARVRSVLRRATRAPEREEVAKAYFADWELDFTSRHLTSPDGEDVALTAAEFELMSIFVRHPNRVLSREQLLDLAYGRVGGSFDRSIDVRVSRLRRLIEEDPAQPRLIKTIRGAGYIFSVPVQLGRFTQPGTDKASL